MIRVGEYVYEYDGSGKQYRYTWSIFRNHYYFPAIKDCTKVSWVRIPDQDLAYVLTKLGQAAKRWTYNIDVRALKFGDRGTSKMCWTYIEDFCDSLGIEDKYPCNHLNINMMLGC